MRKQELEELPNHHDHSQKSIVTIHGKDFEYDADDYVDFGTVSRDLLGLQAQYGSRYLDGRVESPNLGIGLRYECKNEDCSNYHFIKIHKDDIGRFVSRVYAYKTEGVIPENSSKERIPALKKRNILSWIRGLFAIE